MTDDVRYTDDALAALTDFLRDAERALDPDEVLQRYCERYPELIDELRAQAGLAMIAPAEAPAELPDVVLVRELGRGGMGVVYEGWQTSLDRPVAVKLSRLSAAREDRERFLRECRTLARLHQTAIVPIHAAGRFGPWLYCVMPLILGATLADLVRRARGVVAAGGTVADLPSLAAQAVRNLPVPGATSPPGRLAPGYFRSVAEALVAVADGLEYAHREGIWHLDVKPSNVMMEPTGHCWLIDFGLARRARRSPVADAAPAADTSKLRGDLTQHVTDSAGEGR